MNDLCFFASDLHGQQNRYDTLFKQVRGDTPGFVLLGGDLLPRWSSLRGDFLNDYFFAQLRELKADMGLSYPRWLVILGNDDPRIEEENLVEAEEEGLLYYLNMRKLQVDGYTFYGYSFVPPTPFMLKDWEKYDVGMYADPGCTHPTEGFRSVEIKEDIRYTNIAMDLTQLCGNDDLTKAVFLFHSPPYGGNLDRAALDGMQVEYVPLDLHVGSIAIQRFIGQRQPLLTLHGHIHESSRLTGSWRDISGRTHSFTGAFDKPGLALVRFRLTDIEHAQRILY